ncbi:autotransporter outer membrane beta-barrel domain-containing protein [Campylobacter sp. JMF_04 NA10]|uniref:autotransporter outer membrane beta-barrel domain-containing protein n=1 Tax=Campylobacter sp. JMF_04 NA10 TaxID=2983824 RepID=UPI0022E9B26D|nr:autotransporter outer membrane beta-barrel domain-containing protein [Campylobacter sp. JMF_04 NA10]MDA3076397.1 autotransporter outer membrane beta-barrel domain-containing protein [Campylobacter sp. JMF_04 NA10]
MKNPLKFSVVAAVALTSVVPNLALGAENDYDIFWSNTKDKIVYTNNLGPETEIEKRFGDKELKAHSGNNVRINLNNSSGLVSFDNYIFGGYRLEALNLPEDASNNTVTLTSGQVQGGIIGGLSAGVENAFACAFNNNCVFTGNANGNTVIINGDATNYATNYAIGGIGLAFANNNRVFINSGIVEKDVIGGMTAQTAATGNRVYFYGGEVKGDIYGGVGVSIDPNAISTMVGSGFDPSGLTFVKVAGSGQNFTAGNTLYLGSDKTTAIAMNKLKAKNIYNFENIQFVLKGGNINKDDVALTLTDTRKTDLSNSNVEVYFTDATNLSANYPIHLIKTTGELTAPKSGSIQNADKWVNIANLLNIVGSIGVSTDKKFLDLSFTGNAVVLPKDKIFNIIAQNKYTRKMADETDKEFTLNGSFDNEELTAPDGSVSYGSNVVNVDFTGDSFGHRNIYGGKADGGQLIKNNTVNLKNGIFFGVTDIYGGYALSDDAYINKINITGGSKSDLGGGIYGGYSYSGNTKENTANINGGKFSDISIYGGYAEKGSSSLNVIEMKSGEVGSLIGGRSASSNVLKNDVYLSGGTVTGDVIGGSGLSGSVIDNNTVTIEGGTVKGDVYGAYHGNWQKDYTVKNNTINYTGGEIQGSIYAHKGANTSSNNTLNIGKNPSNPLTLGRTLKAYNIYNFDNLNFYLPSDIADKAIALKLSDTGETDLSKTTVNAYLNSASNLNANSVVHLIQTAGTLTAPANNDAEQTKVNIAGLLDVKGYVKLAEDKKNLDLYFKAPTPTATWKSKDKIFNITAPDKFTRTMVDSNGNEKEQEFAITGWFDNSELKTITDATNSNGTEGTFANSFSGNIVNVDLGSGGIEEIYGGIGGTGQNVSGNTINFNSGTFEEMVGGDSSDGEASGNKVIMNGGGDAMLSNVYGGRSSTGKVSGNKVFINGGQMDDVYGGKSYSAGKVSGNEVVINDGYIHTGIYGGTSWGNGEVSDNTVTLLGGDLSHATIKGFENGSTASKNNTLNIGSSTQKLANSLSAKNIYNFENLNFYLKDSLANDFVALKLSDAPQTDLTKTNITVDNLSSYIDGTGNKYYLLKSYGEISVDSTWLSGTRTYDNVFNVISKTEYNVAKGGIFQSSDKKDLYITSTTDSTESITGDTFGDNEAGIADGITVNLTKGADYGDLKLNLSKQTTINLANAKNVGEINAASSVVSITNSTLNGSTSVKSLNLSGDITAGNDILTVNNIVLNQADLTLNGGLRSTNGSIIFGDSKATITGDIEANKVSFFSGSNLNTITANDIKAKEIEFYLSNSVKYDSTALKLTTTGNTDLSSTKVSAFLADASGLSGTGVIHLIQTAGKLTAPSTTDVSGVDVNVGNLINVKANIELDANQKNLDLKFNGDPDNSGGGSTGGLGTGGSGSGGAKANENSKQLLETNLAGLIAVGEAGSMLGSNLDSIVNLAANGGESGSDAVVYAVSSGNDKKYKTGSHVESKGFSVNVGVAGTHSLSGADLTTGAFIEYGRASFETHLDNGLVGKGDTELIGGGVFAKYQSVAGYYTEGSLRVGKLKTEADKGLYDEYEISSSYYGAHFGVGKVFALGASNDLDIYAKYFYSHTEGDEITLKGVNVAFDAMSSHKVKFGVKDTMKFSETSAVYAGLAYQHEFDGDATGRVSVLNQSASIASPSLKGASGIAEVGYTYDSGALKFDIGAKGYAGKERGYSGNVGLTFRF